MPELPEVEITAQGIRPYIERARVRSMEIRQRRLRWPIPQDLPAVVLNKQLKSIERRSKYLLFCYRQGVQIIHLGMSGSLSLVAINQPWAKHEHWSMTFTNGQCLRYRDSRRFGACLWQAGDAGQHPLLCRLGPEPLTTDFGADYLHQTLCGRSRPIKSVIMDAQVVVGVGNIYAAEALFQAGIHPHRSASTLSIEHCAALVQAIQSVLSQAIAQGGTTLKDFQYGKQQLGYFQQHLQVYGRQGQPCVRCGESLQRMRLAQRSTVFCAQCQC